MNAKTRSSPFLSIADGLDGRCILGISPSLKPARGLSTPSATREILKTALSTIATIHPQIALLDLRELSFPWFDGRCPEDMGVPAVDQTLAAIRNAGGLLFAIPAYWGAVSGSFKNFIEVVCGPNYGGASAATILSRKRVKFFVVGADAESAEAGAAQARSIFAGVGACVEGEPVCAASSRERRLDMVALTQAVVAQAGELALSLVRAPGAFADAR